MPMPPSVTKVTKDGVTFTSNVDQAQYLLSELIRAALRDCAKYIRREAKRRAPVRSGIIKENIATWVKKNKGTGELELQVGVYKPSISKKKGKREARHAHLVYFGTGPRISEKTGKSSGIMPANPFIEVAITDNIRTIREIQGKYLSAIANKISAQAYVDEGEEVSDDESI